MEGPALMVRAVPIPAECRLEATQHDADFADAYEVLVPASGHTTTEIYRAITRRTPVWVEKLMWLRNRVVQHFGLKNLGAMSAVREGEAVPGQRMGLFEVVSSSPHELVLQDDDKHLLVQLSVLKQAHDDLHDRLTLSTVVHVHNTFGRIYMFFVGPAHKVIAPAVMRQAVRALATPPRESTSR
ncbi:DUF2867 domain-containing protein [Polaromonas sp.]|uniref:DUF2867 domain-containing protein n=1 Tax=Polaromonas sp. TaxID=1869339 RepID=UPI003264BB46